MKQLSIFLVILISSTINGYSQDMKLYLERKAQAHIDSVYSEAKDILEKYGEDGAIMYGYYLHTKPYMWKWKGYEEPIYTDSLVCNNPIIMKWAEEELKLTYDTLTLIERERRFPVIKVDLVNRKAILCIIHARSENGGNSMHGTVNTLLKETLFSYEGVTPLEYSSLEGYWWVDNKCVLVTGNNVDMFFERYKNQRMGSPLPPHMTFDDTSTLVYPGSTQGLYWSYKNQKLLKHYFDKKGREPSPFSHRVSIYEREYYYEKLRKSFKHNKFK